MFDRLFEKAYKQGGSLKYHIRFLLDEFANSGKIPNFQRIIAVLRSMEYVLCFSTVQSTT